MRVTVRIDRERCIVAGLCMIHAPMIFVPEEADGKPAVAPEYRVGPQPDVGEIPRELLGPAKEAEANCPVRAIQVGR